LEIDEKLRFIFRCTLGTKILSNAQNISLNGYGMYEIILNKSKGDEIERRNNFID